MKKIAVISMVKNESDIIEHFVRHNLSFADIVIIMDHDSCDGTSEILQYLQKEDNRLIVYKCDTMGHIQSEVMTSLMKDATLKYGADMIVPLDADEFLLSYSGSDVRTAIMSLPDDTVCQLPLVSHSIDDASLLSEQFILNCPCKLLQELGGAKVLITAGKWNWQSMMLHQGNHYVSCLVDNAWNDITAKAQGKLYIAHFAKRSHEQQVSKFVVGWVQNTAKYSKYTTVAHVWGNKFKELLNGTYQEEESFPAVRTYDKLQDEICQIKYGKLSKINPFRNLQITAEKMANKVALCECLLAGNKADVILFECNNVEACTLSLMSVRMQGYAVDKVFMVSVSSEIANKISDMFSDLDIILINDILHIREQSKAGYLQFMYAGDEMEPEKISMGMTAIYQYQHVEAIYFNGVITRSDSEDIIIEQNTGMPHLSGNQCVSTLKQNRLLPSGGIVGFLFKKNIVEAIDWFNGYKLDGKYLYWLAICHMLLQCDNVALISDKVVKSVAGTVEDTIPYKMQIDAIDV